MLYGTEEDRGLIDIFIMYPMLLTIFDRDLKVIQTSPFKLKRPYILLIERVMDDISMELHETRKKMMAKRIKVMDPKRLEDVTEYEIFIRGYREIMRFPNVHLRNKAEILLERFLLKNRV
ncbi:hypothetical protein ACFFJY_12920 [Fictibacillus aquaticus]|uniref:Uncharacterized protein n=1 Tax=Fictibacillus aquaticus TaxID=2021314 RepID=A0A235FDV4_9BACL|nr:hypothetical protein [Fictibacillus aquaticus]OYD59133.1 hypothetical protein CGZ90_04340 [Fictibacillus aquaticus]